MITVPPPSAERLAELDERWTYYRPAAEQAATAALDLARKGKAVLGDKVLLVDVAKHLGYGAINPTFARLLALWQALGWIKLARIDLTGTVNARRLFESELVVGDLATFHAVATGYRPNPSRGAPTAEAEAKFREFHQKAPRQVGAFALELEIPREVELCGDAIHVLYRSDKVDPETGEQPTAPINYIHEHDSFGVQTFQPLSRAAASRHVKGPIVATTPWFLRDAPGLVLLGDCLGLAFHSVTGIDVELEADPPYDQLYTTPCGRALAVVRSRREFVFFVWGGELGVEDRGIVG